MWVVIKVEVTTPLKRDALVVAKKSTSSKCSDVEEAPPMKGNARSLKTLEKSDVVGG